MSLVSLSISTGEVFLFLVDACWCHVEALFCATVEIIIVVMWRDEKANL
jgi:hypothetical protein